MLNTAAAEMRSSEQAAPTNSPATPPTAVASPSIAVPPAATAKAVPSSNGTTSHRLSARTLGILRQCLAGSNVPSCRVWVYGSRARGTGHAGSDIDLALEGSGTEPIQFSHVARFLGRVDESALLLHVDALSLDARMDENMKQTILDERKFLFEHVGDPNA